MKGILDLPKWMQMLAVLKRQNEVKTNISQLGYLMKTTFSHVYRLVFLLEEKGLIKTIKQGRSVTVELTKEGENKARCCGELEEWNGKQQY